MCFKCYSRFIVQFIFKCLAHFDQTDVTCFTSFVYIWWKLWMRIWFHLHDLLSFLLDCCCVQVFIEILSLKCFYICTSQMWIEMSVKSPKLQQVPHVCDLNFRLWGFVLFCLKSFGILSVYHIKLDSDQCGLFCSGLNTNVGHQKEKKNHKIHPVEFYSAAWTLNLIPSCYDSLFFVLLIWCLWDYQLV